MTVHRPHPIQGDYIGKRYDDPDDAILWDDCDRCSEHAQHPLSSLDNEHLVALAEMTDLQSWTNETEHRACISLAESLFNLDDALDEIAALGRARRET